MKRQFSTSVILEDHVMFGEVLEKILNEENSIRCVSRPSSIGETEEALDLMPDLVIFDRHLFGGNGLELFTRFRKKLPTTEWILCSSIRSASFLKEALRIGVRGIVLKSSSLDSFRRAISELEKGNEYLCASCTNLLISCSREAGFGHPMTSREYEILRGLSEGLEPRDIAGVLSISVKTVHHHVASIFRKLEVKTYVAAVKKAERDHWI